MASVYKLQNSAIHEARRQLEDKGVFIVTASLDQVRELAGQINGGMRSISALSLQQRKILIDRLIDLGAEVKNPVIYESDFRAEAEAAGVKRKVLPFSRVTEKQARMLNALADQITWYSADSYAHLKENLFGAPEPRNYKEVTRLAATLRSMIEKQRREQEARA